jgi:phage shock protein A
LGKATEASNAIGDNSNAAAFDRMKSKVRRHEATAQAHADLGADDVNAKFAAMEKQEEIDRLLQEIKSKRNP